MDDLAFAAWNWVPLWWELPAEDAAARIRLMAEAYGGATADGPSAADIVSAVVPDSSGRSP